MAQQRGQGPRHSRFSNPVEVATGSLPAPGHNGGPALEPVQRPSGRCLDCRHWTPPPESWTRAYEAFRLGFGRRVKRPTGSCDRALIGNSRGTAFTSTDGHFGCTNFDAKAIPPRPPGGGYVTIWSGNRVLWEGPEEKVPARFDQTNLDLSGPDADGAGEGDAIPCRESRG